jgi:hypothetical protein
MQLFLKEGARKLEKVGSLKSGISKEGNNSLFTLLLKGNQIMTANRLLRLMNDEEKKQYEDSMLKEYGKATTSNLEIYFKLSLKLKQQIDIKLSTIESILDQRKPDYKVKQYGE